MSVKPVKNTPIVIRTLSALTAAGAWDAGDAQYKAIPVAGHREATLYVMYNAHASTTTGYPHILPLISYDAEPQEAGTGNRQPDPVAKKWYMLPATDGTVTASTLTGTKVSGSDFTYPTGGVGIVQCLGLVLKTPAATANSDVVMQAFGIKLLGARWLQFNYAEKGDTTNVGSLECRLVLHS